MTPGAPAAGIPRVPGSSSVYYPTGPLASKPTVRRLFAGHLPYRRPHLTAWHPYRREGPWNPRRGHQRSAGLYRRTL